MSYQNDTYLIAYFIMDVDYLLSFCHIGTESLNGFDRGIVKVCSRLYNVYGGENPNTWLLEWALLVLIVLDGINFMLLQDQNKWYTIMGLEKRGLSRRCSQH